MQNSWGKKRHQSKHSFVSCNRTLNVKTEHIYQAFSNISVDAENIKELLLLKVRYSGNLTNLLCIQDAERILLALKNVQINYLTWSSNKSMGGVLCIF